MQVADYFRVGCIEAWEGFWMLITSGWGVSRPGRSVGS